MAGNEVLSEGEIDALMDNIDDVSSNGHAGDDGEYRKFDFTAREYALLREFSALQTLIDRHFELFREALETMLSMECWVKVEPATLISVSDAVASLDRAVAVSTVALEPLQADAFVTSPSAILSGFVNAYFGGGRNMGEPDTERTSITTSELRLAERIASHLIDTLVIAWGDKIELTAGTIDTLEFPDRLAALPAEDLLLRIRFPVTLGVTDSDIQLFIPFAALEPYRAVFVPPKRLQHKEKAASRGWEQHLRRELPVIELELAAVLGSRRATIGELMKLRTGSIIPIGSAESVTISLDDIVLAEGRYGSHDGAKAVQIERITVSDSNAG